MKIKCPKCNSTNVYIIEEEAVVDIKSEIFEGSFYCCCRDCEVDTKIYFEIENPKIKFI